MVIDGSNADFVLKVCFVRRQIPCLERSWEG